MELLKKLLGLANGLIRWLSFRSRIKREHYFIPSLEDIISKLAGAQYFSIVDNGFWQIPLDEKSSEYCTFNSPFGRYCFTRMPYGICSAPEIFQNRIKNIFEGINGIDIYIDDILIWGKTLEEHNKRLVKVFEMARKNNLKFNLKECKFALNEIKYMGHKIGINGLQIDESKVKAIKAMPVPENKKDVERFVGCVNYLNRFIPNYSDITAPLRELIKKNVEFKWQIEQQQAFDKLKE